MEIQLVKFSRTIGKGGRGREGESMKVVSSNCFSWQCHKNNARRKISLGYSTVSRIWHFAFAFALLKFLDPLDPLPCNTHTYTPSPSPLRSSRVTNPKVVYPAYCALAFFPFLLHLPWLGPKGPHGKSVSLSVYVSLSLFLSLFLSLSLCSSLFSPALLL